jgi:hypothetical protein
MIVVSVNVQEIAKEMETVKVMENANAKKISMDLIVEDKLIEK